MNAPGVPPMPGNSYTQKAKGGSERPKVNKVIEGEAIRRKKTLGRQVKETFRGDDIHSVAIYVLLDILIPSARDLLFESFTGGFQRFLYGDGPTARRAGIIGRALSNRQNIPYNEMSKPTTFKRMEPAPVTTAANVFEFDDIVVPDRAAAEVILDHMFSLIETYGVASVADLYELAGISADYTVQRWGWKNLSTASIVRVREGYMFSFPRPMDLGS